jgi:phage terminase Nu1 subunit (DNA packaging protein)
LDRSLTQDEFASLVGVSQQAVSDLVQAGLLLREETGGAWLLAYCKRLREMAAGRDPDSNLSVQRARVASETADKIAMANAVTRGEYAPINYLAAVLSAASTGVAEGFDHMGVALRASFPDLPQGMHDMLSKRIAEIRNRWVVATEERVLARFSELSDDVDMSQPDDDLETAGADTAASDGEAIGGK